MVYRTWHLFRRAESGPIVKEKDFDLRRYWPRLKELVKENDIRYDPEKLVPTDESIIDQAYDMGMRLLLDVGFLCRDSSRLITFEENEVKEVLRALRENRTVGQGKDAVSFEYHALEDSRPPAVVGGPCGTALSEQYALKIYESYAQEPLLGVMYMGALESVEGLGVKGGSPLELQAEMTNISLARTALRKAGRPGLALYGSCFPSLTVELASSSPEYGYRTTDMRPVWAHPQLKVSYDTLTRALHSANYGSRTFSSGNGYIGGLAGGPEGAMVTSIAETLGLMVLVEPYIVEPYVMNNLYQPWVGDSDMMSLWAGCLAKAAFAKKTRIPRVLGCYTYAGPCTEMCLWELAAESIAGAALGAHVYGTAPNSGRITDHCTGMETGFRAEVAHAATGIKRGDANEIVRKITAKYQKAIESRNPPYGKSFAECYDVETITPSKEYLDLRREVRAELEDLGI